MNRNTADYAVQWDLCINLFPLYVASSVTGVVVILNTPTATNQLLSITVTCTIHPDSTADQCVVMAMADGRATITGIP